MKLSKKVLRLSKTVTVDASGTNTVTIKPKYGERYHLKKIVLTSGANTTVDIEGVIIDGVPTSESATFDVEAVFGALITCSHEVKVTASNVNTNSEDLTVELIGYIEV